MEEVLVIPRVLSPAVIEAFALLGTTFEEATTEQHAFAAQVHSGCIRAAEIMAEEATP